MHFVNPVFMAAGGALISAPIIIHLINRMRFKRVRWAAMEFLLKSQKRNRRKLIIEQLILLALRCLLVMLAGLLLSRLQLGGDSGVGAYHFVVLDDTPSMGDQWHDDTGKHTSLEVAKGQLTALAKTLATAATRQELRVVLLSDPTTALSDGPVDKGTATKLGAALEAVELQPKPYSPLRAVEKARDVLTAQVRGRKVFHFVSDFRDHDWSGADAQALKEKVQGLLDIGTHVDYMDVAEPYRPASGETKGRHPNIAVVDLRAQTTVAAADLPVEFTAGLYNYGTQSANSFMHVYSRQIYLREPDKAKGEAETLEAGEAFQERVEATTTIEALPPGQRTDRKFTLVLPKKQHNPDLEVKPDDKPEDRARKRRADAEFVQVRVEIDDNPADQGLAADNVRDAVVEVRSKVPVLVVDGDPSENKDGNKSKLYGDVFWLEVGLAAAASYEVEYYDVKDLNKVNLDQYANVLLVNVPQFKEPGDLEKVKKYVANGGSVAWFIGGKNDGSEAVHPKYYNTAFFQGTENENHEHLFPLLLEDTLPALPKGDEAEAARVKQMQNDPQQKIVFPEPDHRIIAPLANPKFIDTLRYLRIDCYYKARPVSEWDPEPHQSQQVVVMPNRFGFDELKGRAGDLVQQADKAAGELAAEEVGKPEKEKKYTKYKPVMDRYLRRVTEALSIGADNPLFRLTTALDALLRDQGVKDDPEHPNMPELWAHPKMKALANDLKAIFGRLKFGDPLVVTRPYGRGRVLAFLTSAGTNSKWNEWASGPCVLWYPIFLREMQRYLISEADLRNRTLQENSDLALDPLDPSRYKGEVRINFLPQPTPRTADGKQAPVKLDPLTQLPKPDQDKPYVVRREPKLGVYTFEVFPQDPAGGRADPELQAFAYNLDAAAEGDLLRATKETLMPQKPRAGVFRGEGLAALRSPSKDSAPFDEFKDPPPDLSSSIWLFLFLLAVFAAEQAMAVHLSFHLKQSEASATPAPGAGPAAAA